MNSIVYPRQGSPSGLQVTPLLPPGYVPLTTTLHTQRFTPGDGATGRVRAAGSPSEPPAWVSFRTALPLPGVFRLVGDPGDACMGALTEAAAGAPVTQRATR